MTPSGGWLQVDVTVDQERADAVEQAWDAAGADALTLLPAEAAAPVVEPAPDQTPLWQQLTLRALFPWHQDADPSELMATLGAALLDAEAVTLCGKFVPDQPWERAWLEHFEPAWFGRRRNLCICPWHETVEGRAVLRMDPGLAFGTGSHATTALCLDALADMDLRGARVLDVGCGSGILALSAALLGAAHVVGVDNDPQARLASAENAQRNGLSITVFEHSDEATGPWDLIIANIVSGVLLELAPAIIRAAQPACRLMLSGLLEGQAAAVTEAYGGHFGTFRQTHRDGWLLLDSGPGSTVS